MAVLPAVGRAAPVVVGLVVVAFALAAADAPSAVGAISGALVAGAGAIATLWAAKWPELDSARGFVQRMRRRATAQQ